jgi:hypothetical protein
MSEILIGQPGAFIKGDAPVKDVAKAGKPAPDTAQDEAPPIGYRRVARRWRVLPDGTRDYAAYHGKTEFTFLLPVSSRLRTPGR